MPARGTILLGLSFFALIAWIIAMATDIAWADQSNGQGFATTIPRETHVDTWFTCTDPDPAAGSAVPVCFRNNDDELDCQEYADRFRVVQSFLVMAGILLLPLIICSALDRFALLSDERHTFGPRAILMALSGVIMMFSIVSFSVAFSIPKTRLCDRREFADAPGFRWGPSPFFTALICLLTFISLIVAAVKRGYVYPDKRAIVVTQPVTTQPYGTQPMATQPYGTQPYGTHPAAAQPVAVRA
jgi:hypothetical protein